MPSDLPYPIEAVKSPVHMLHFYDEDISSGKVKLECWQIEMLRHFAKEHKYLERALQSILLAANGSGKSQFIIAPLIMWFLMRFPLAQAMVTNASGKQLDSGNLRHSTLLGQKINRFHEKDCPEGIFKLQYRKIECNITGSICDYFATDSGGQVEGRHPLTTEGKFLRIVDEAKSITEDIWEGLAKSHDFTHSLIVSSAGAAHGVFYQDWINPKLNSYVLKKKVTVKDCPHIPDHVVQEAIDRYGEHSPVVRNMFYSEFSSADQQVVIKYEDLLKCAGACNNWFLFGPIRAGLDLAAGGDESVISVWNGNKEIATAYFDNTDTSKTVREVIDFINSIKGLKDENIYADDGGVGRGILDNFREKGYKFRRLLNNQKAWDFTHYANRGTELWFNFKRFIEQCQVLFRLDSAGNIEPKLLSQLSQRYYKIQDASGKVLLESKQKAKAEGHPSPDRADAVVLAWSQYVYPLAEITGITNKKVESFGKPPEIIAEELRNIDREKLLAQLNGSRRGPLIIPSRLTEQQLANTNTYRHGKIFGSGRNNKGLNKYFR